MTSAEVDNFKKIFKYYKRRDKTPDLSNVVDLGNDGSKNEDFTQIELDLKEIEIDENNLKELGLTDPSEWKVYSSNINKGLLFIVNPFTTTGQRYWIQTSYLDYPNPPNVTNLDSPNNEKRHRWSKNDVHSWKYLRWTTLGYHHNWDTKVYSLDHHTPFPTDLSTLTQFFAKVLKFPPYFAEAAIVNYYHLDSTLAGHVDRSEFDLDAPLFSIRFIELKEAIKSFDDFGLPAIFLLGGPTKSIEPSAILLRSGDVAIMTGESRLSYHAVPRILPNNSIGWATTDESERIEWREIKNLISKSRLNLNVRQVFPHRKN